MGFGEAPTVTKVAAVIAFIAFVLNIIGFAAPYWVSSESSIIKYQIYRGLWMRCEKFIDRTSCDVFDSELLPDYYEATRSFEAIGFLASIGSIVFLILYTCVPKTSGSKIVAILTAIALIGASGCIILGVIIFGSKESVDILSWAFALSTVGGILFGISGLLVFVSMCARK